jgi:hypothetical protein
MEASRDREVSIRKTEIQHSEEVLTNQTHPPTWPREVPRRRRRLKFSNNEGLRKDCFGHCILIMARSSRCEPQRPTRRVANLFPREARVELYAPGRKGFL